MIEVRNLTKKYGDHIAVDNLSFTVEKGQIYGFLGPNGAGKSTTMNIITGYLAATEGEVIIDGHDILKEPENAKSCIGYLPEQPPLYQDMTVDEYLMFVAQLRKLSKSECETGIKKVKEILAIDEVSGRLIKNLSKGYKQRVGFAQALIGLPELLILDEPTVGLDPKQIIEIRDLIKKLGRDHTIILSSHILSEVSAICDHIMIISKGKLVASDTPENLMRMMQPVTTLNMTVLAEKQIVEAAVSAVKDIVSYTVKKGSESGSVDITVKYMSDMDLRSSISQQLTENGCIIIEMGSTSASLEDIFLELTDSKYEEVELEEESDESEKGEEIKSEIDDGFADDEKKDEKGTEAKDDSNI